MAGSSVNAVKYYREDYELSERREKTFVALRSEQS